MDLIASFFFFFKYLCIPIISINSGIMNLFGHDNVVVKMTSQTCCAALSEICIEIGKRTACHRTNSFFKV